MLIISLNCVIVMTGMLWFMYGRQLPNHSVLTVLMTHEYSLSCLWNLWNLWNVFSSCRMLMFSSGVPVVPVLMNGGTRWRGWDGKRCLQTKPLSRDHKLPILSPFPQSSPSGPSVSSEANLLITGRRQPNRSVESPSGWLAVTAITIWKRVMAFTLSFYTSAGKSLI